MTDTEAPTDWFERIRWYAAHPTPLPPAFCFDCRVELTLEQAGRNLRCPRCWQALLDAQPALQAGTLDPRGPLCTSCRGTLEGCEARHRGGYGRCCRSCTHTDLERAAS